MSVGHLSSNTVHTYKGQLYADAFKYWFEFSKILKFNIIFLMPMSLSSIKFVFHFLCKCVYIKYVRNTWPFHECLWVWFIDVQHQKSYKKHSTLSNILSFPTVILFK